MEIVNHDFPHQGRDSAFGSLKLFEADGLECQDGQMSSLILDFKYQGLRAWQGACVWRFLREVYSYHYDLRCR